MKSSEFVQSLIVLPLITAVLLIGCATPYKQQQAFKEAVSKSPALEHLYTTDIYNIYYDKVIKKCVMHSISQESSGDGIGLGVGVSEFVCDPEEIRERAENLRSK